MFSLASASFFGLAGVSLVAALLTAAALGDVGAAALFLAVALVAVLAALAVFGAVGPDRAPAVAADVAPTRVPVDRPDVATGSVWPIGAALAMGVLAVGFVVGSATVALGVVVAVVVAFGWLAQSWREAPGWTGRLQNRMANRFVVPFALPVGVIVLIGVSVVAFSRILLAVDKNTATLLALVAAVLLLGGCSLVALRPGLGSRAVGALAALAVLLVLAAGIIGAAKGEREFHKVGGHADAPEIVASSLTEFETDEIVLPAEQTVEVVFENAHDGVPHNVGFYESEGGAEIFRGATITGPADVTYEFETPAAGEYYFQCDVHPNMKGTLVVEEASEGEGAGGSGDH